MSIPTIRLPVASDQFLLDSIHLPSLGILAATRAVPTENHGLLADLRTYSLGGKEMTNQRHWQQVHESKVEEQVSWFQARPEMSLRLIKETGVTRGARIIDVGGGASRLVDCLLDDGFSSLAVLDIAEGGLSKAKQRLGARAKNVEWIVSDVTSYRAATQWDLWHDRAVFHFLVDESAREAYRQVVERAVGPRGHVILATFGPDGPERCSGLPVVRYGAEDLSAELGSAFTLRRSVIEQHRTPAGAVQEFLYCWFERGA
jgi:SAM-dependent methyltransferase